jgi:hypothetical protein
VTVAALARRPATLHRRIGETGTTDPYNNDPGVWEAVPTRAFGTQRRANETTDDGGQIDAQDWFLAWADDFPAAASDRVEITGLGIFELTGPAHRVVHPQTERFSHVEATGRAVT